MCGQNDDPTQYDFITDKNRGLYEVTAYPPVAKTEEELEEKISARPWDHPADCGDPNCEYCNEASGF